MAADKEPKLTFTVCTPTFNRGHTLPRVYHSLLDQSFQDFEWLIVDDGSTDDTADTVAKFQADAPFQVRYVRQENSGKHVAVNRAVGIAEGRLFLILDSDDECVSDALERFLARWEEIDSEHRDEYVGVTALCVQPDGTLVGTPFPCDPFDSTILETTYVYGVTGEKWGFQRTDVLREHRFPEPPGYRGYVPESTVWLAIARRYRTRYVNERLRIYHASENQITRMHPESNALGQLLYHQQLLNDHLDWLKRSPKELVRRMIQYSRYGIHVRRPVRDQWQALSDRPTRVLWLTTYPLAAALAYADRRRSQREGWGGSTPR